MPFHLIVRLGRLAGAGIDYHAREMSRIFSDRIVHDTALRGELTTKECMIGFMHLTLTKLLAERGINLFIECDKE